MCPLILKFLLSLIKCKDPTNRISMIWEIIVEICWCNSGNNGNLCVIVLCSCIHFYNREEVSHIKQSPISACLLHCPIQFPVISHGHLMKRFLLLPMTFYWRYSILLLSPRGDCNIGSGLFKFPYEDLMLNSKLFLI